MSKTVATTIGRVVIPHDPANEQVIVAAALVDRPTRAALMLRVQEDMFQLPEHQNLWRGLRELENRQLEYDPATLMLVVPGVDLEYLNSLLEARPEVPPNLEYHVEALLWDKRRALAVEGPIAALLESLKQPTTPHDRVRALAKQVSEVFETSTGDRCIQDSEQVAAAQRDEIRGRIGGVAIYPYGIEGFDYDEKGEARVIQGAAPGQVTVVTGVTGSGKSTVTSLIVLGLAKKFAAEHKAGGMKRTVLVGAWEQNSGMTLELLACQSLQWSRTDMMLGRLDDDQVDRHYQTMRAVGRYVKFVSNPFVRSASERRGKERPSNDGNLDKIHSLIAETGASVFVADLWRRCLRDGSVEAEEAALTRQQSIAEETQCHCILVQQQRHKDVETRPDKRPTREGIKGSGAWTEIADTVIGVHRPALWKNVPDNVCEIDILKQRRGQWPLAVEFTFDPAKGLLSDGRGIPYDFTQGPDGGSEFDSAFPKPAKKPWKPKPK